MKSKSLFFIMLFALSYFAKGQKISIAPGLDVRNDGLFALIGQVGNKILTFENSDKKYILNIFDSKLHRYTSRTLEFEKKQIKIISISHEPKSWVLVYSYRDKKNEIVNAYRYDNVGNRIDSSRILVQKRDLLERSFKFTESEDEKQLLIFKKINSKSVLFIRIDVAKLKATYSKTIEFEDIRFNTDFRMTLISNSGTFYTIFEKSPSIFNSSKHKLIVNAFINDKEKAKSKIINLDFKINNFTSKYDNINKTLNIVGIKSKQYSEKSNGYFIFRMDDNLTQFKKIEKKYSLGLLKDFYRLRNKKIRNHINNIHIKDILFRNDGGMIIVFELKELISRQNNDIHLRTRGFRSNIDYIFGELGIISLHEDGEVFWHKIIPKHQFSSNDFGIYSSVFIFKTPSLLKIIFNDEIRDKNQIMMYTINPLGKSNRMSLFSTELYNLNLAFKKSLQISNNKLIVPSYRNEKLRLVMIEF